MAGGDAVTTDAVTGAGPPPVMGTGSGGDIPRVPPAVGVCGAARHPTGRAPAVGAPRAATLPLPPPPPPGEPGRPAHWRREAGTDAGRAAHWQRPSSTRAAALFFLVPGRTAAGHHHHWRGVRRQAEAAPRGGRDPTPRRRRGGGGGGGRDAQSGAGGAAPPRRRPVRVRAAARRRGRHCLPGHGGVPVRGARRRGRGWDGRARAGARRPSSLSRPNCLQVF